jgi:hypothetical protein
MRGMTIHKIRSTEILGSLSLEFTRLAQLTGKRKYFDSISKITNHLDDAQNHTRIPGLWPSTIDTKGPSFPSSSFTLGAFADSLYEYLPKVFFVDKYLGASLDMLICNRSTSFWADRRISTCECTAQL